MNDALVNFNQIDFDTTTLLMNRVDFKFVLTGNEAILLLKTIDKEYDVISKEGNLFRYYETAYFDTDNKASFAMHHNGKLPRYKIRTRTYIDSNDQFLEIKCKNNKGRTEKKDLRLLPRKICLSNQRLSLF